MRKKQCDWCKSRVAIVEVTENQYHKNWESICRKCFEKIRYNRNYSKKTIGLIPKFHPGDIVNVKAWWREGATVRCEVLGDLPYYHEGGYSYKVREAANKGSHQRAINEDDIITE